MYAIYTSYWFDSLLNENMGTKLDFHYVNSVSSAFSIISNIKVVPLLIHHSISLIASTVTHFSHRLYKETMLLDAVPKANKIRYPLFTKTTFAFHLFLEKEPRKKIISDNVTFGVFERFCETYTYSI